VDVRAGRGKGQHLLLRACGERFAVYVHDEVVPPVAPAAVGARPPFVERIDEALRLEGLLVHEDQVHEPHVLGLHTPPGPRRVPVALARGQARALEGEVVLGDERFEKVLVGVHHQGLALLRKCPFQ
jgi:hypothetical protein